MIQLSFLYIWIFEGRSICPVAKQGDDFDDEGGVFTFHTRFLKYKKIILNKKIKPQPKVIHRLYCTANPL